ncbi:hypothetical protein N658DRAFT_481372 [Parathielavia hyrcaniae]|uniref:Ankyrin n=1 Tax=Parathielavia hyrcaniae TaxID=113614 RepID=A0AAN6PQA8_9PEZI|nr:hypothetical protein N658DRAFT_481372 [Parathielavia hyrcaniae]
MANDKSPPPASNPDRRHRPPFGEISTAQTTASVDTGSLDFSDLPGLPRLRYRILDYKLKLFVVVALLVLESSLLPIALYYGLVLASTLRHGLVFAIITSFFGIVTGIEFGLRSWKLIFKGDTYRPVGGTKWSMDFTHWTLSFGYTVMTVILIIFSVPYDPFVRPLAIPVSVFLIQAGLQLTWAGCMNTAKRPAPFDISSIPKGARVPPLVLTLVEDIVGVDGGAGREYRNTVLARYEASPRFKKMIAQQNWFWAVGALVDGIGTMAVIWTVPERVAYGVGTSTIKMASHLASLPPEMVLHIAEFLDRRHLSRLICAAGYLYAHLDELLYKREVTQGRLDGLVYAIRRGAATAVSKFIAAGSDVNAMVNMTPDIQDFMGYASPLAIAVVRGQRQIVEILLDNGARVLNPFSGALCYAVFDHTIADRNTPLSIALLMGCTDIAIDLVRSTENKDGFVSTHSAIGELTGLEQAISCLRPEVVRELLAKGADPNRRRPGHPTGPAPLHTFLGQHGLHPYGISRIPGGEALVLKTVLTLLEYGADPFLKEFESCPSLHRGHPSNCPCNPTACQMGSTSHHSRVRLHFSDIEHRQNCNKPPCRQNRHNHWLLREDLPGYCQGYPGERHIHEPASVCRTGVLDRRLSFDVEVGRLSSALG